MDNATATPTKPDPVKLARLWKRMQRHGVTQKAVAERLGVSKFHVCHVLAGRAISAPVLKTAKDLLAEARTGVAAA